MWMCSARWFTINYAVGLHLGFKKYSKMHSIGHKDPNYQLSNH
jgi:hypothetical protein